MKQKNGYIKYKNQIILYYELIIGMNGFDKEIEDASNIEDFITLVKLLQAAEAILGADKILYY